MSIKKLRGVNADKGFTLIELIIVIVILGILAVVAAPRFLDISRDARIANIEAMQGTVKSALQIANAKAGVENKLSGNATVEIDSTNVPINEGYPTASWNDSLRFFVDTADIENWDANPAGQSDPCDSDWCAYTNTGLVDLVQIFPRGVSINEGCSVAYIAAAINSDDGPVRILTDDC